MSEKKKSNIQKIWGFALLVMGIAVFVRVPQVMPAIEAMDHFKSISFLIRFSFYLMGAILVCGGLKKLKDNF